jgi:LCP family protein required for cell wall assembly
VLVVAALIGFVAVRAFVDFRSIERVDLAGVLDPVTGPNVNYLLVGSDSRDGFDPDVGPGGTSTVSGRRSDTIIVLRVTPEGAAMMSIPRDLWVRYPVSGADGRINGAYNAGPAALVRTVQSALGIPVNHYMEVGFASFAGLVDAVGGVTVEVPHPAFDVKSGLRIDQAGPVTLDGAQALAYVRSRTYTEVIDGQEVTDPRADLGRNERQQAFLRTALGEVGSERNPLALLRAVDALSSGLIMDDSISMFDLFGLARKLSGGTPLTVVLPTRPTTIDGAQVLLLQQPQADTVLAAFQ